MKEITVKVKSDCMCAQGVYINYNIYIPEGTDTSIQENDIITAEELIKYEYKIKE